MYPGVGPWAGPLASSYNELKPDSLTSWNPKKLRPWAKALWLAFAHLCNLVAYANYLENTSKYKQENYKYVHFLEADGKMWIVYL